MTDVVLPGRVLVLPADPAHAGGDDPGAAAKQLLHDPEAAPREDSALGVFAHLVLIPWSPCRIQARPAAEGKCGRGVNHGRDSSPIGGAPPTCHSADVADFNCPHCSAEYSVAYETGFRETGRRDCDHCGKEMVAWKDARPPIYVLSRRPSQGC